MSVRDRVIETLKEVLKREPTREEVVEVTHRADQLIEDATVHAIGQAVDEVIGI